MELTVRPLAPELWPALEDLFDTQGPVGRCWCMYWRIGSAYRRRPPEENRAALRGLVESGPPLGLLAFAGSQAVGWCQLTPRGALPWLERSWRLEPDGDEPPVWAISCFYVRKGYRRKGVTAALISGALDAARRAGAPALEAYPLDADGSPSSTSTGYVSTFKRLGFKTVEHRSAPRPIMRFDF